MPVYKRKGSSNSPFSYKPIFLLDLVGKLYESMVGGRLNQTVAARLAEIQHELRKVNSIEQAILSVRTIIKKSLDRRHPMDFDSIPDEVLLNLIQHSRASKNVQRLIRQLHEVLKGTMRGTTQHFTCKRGFRQSSIEGPILFNLFPQEVPEEVFSQCDNNGGPPTTYNNKEQWTLQHLEYAGDLVVTTDPPEIAQELLTR